MIRQAEFARRRRDLMEAAGENSIIIVAAAPERLRNGDSFHPYRQDSDFLYLTGLSEPESVLVLVPGRESGEQILFCRERDPERERWDGPRLGLDGAREQLGMDDAFPYQDMDEILPGLMEGRERIYHLVGKDPGFDYRVIGWRNRLRQRRREARGPEEFISLEHLLHEFRMIKSRDEIRCMKKAAAISAEAHRRAMATCRPGMSEAEITAELLHEFQRRGCPPAYQPIVAGGKNALILHYVRNDSPLPADGLLLIDAGCEYEGYASDISRTFPVAGSFSPDQRRVYEIVFAARQAAIDQARPGNPYLAMHEAAVRAVTEGLIDIGLLSGDPADNIEQEHYRRFYMHKTGHWLGLDVHDVGDYRIDGEPRILEKNMVTTVEPGLYIGLEEDIPESLRGIGVRIEDDVRITEDGPEILSAAAPSAPEEIEKLMAGT